MRPSLKVFSSASEQDSDFDLDDRGESMRCYAIVMAHAPSMTSSMSSTQGSPEAAGRRCGSRGRNGGRAALDLSRLGLAIALGIDPAHGLPAGLVRARHQHRQSCAASPGDCVALEAARANDAPLAGAEPHCSTSAGTRAESLRRPVTCTVLDSAAGPVIG